MKNLILIIGYLITINTFGQIACTPIYNPVEVFYPNTTSHSPVPILGAQFLCGPNTIVYDTMQPNINCRIAYLNPGSTLFYSEQCPAQPEFYVKANAILNIMPGAGYPVYIVSEPGAIINNPSGVATNTFSCSNIIFPFVNCATNLETSDLLVTNIHPIPASKEINITQAIKQFNKYEIYSLNGKLVAESKINNILQKIDLSGYAEGMYIVKLIGNQKVEFKKIVVVE